MIGLIKEVPGFCCQVGTQSTVLLTLVAVARGTIWVHICAERIYQITKQSVPVITILQTVGSLNREKIQLLSRALFL